MSSCDFDHPIEDVNKKLAEQKEFLPADQYNVSKQLLEGNPDQHTLNELFHLLKKYDLASEEVREERNKGITELANS